MTKAKAAHDGKDTDSAHAEDLADWLAHAVAQDAGRRLGHGYQGSVHLFSSPFGDVVVKRAHDSPLLGLVGRRALRSEAAVYEQLRGVPGTPKYYGLIDGLLVLEHIEGPSLREYERDLKDAPRFFDLLLDTLEAMHAAGVAHGDLKRKDNILVGPAEQPYVIDFGIALRCSPAAAPWRRALFDVVQQMDYNAWIKLKYRRRLEDMTPEDASRYRPLLLERVARGIRVPWQRVTMRRLRKRRRTKRS